MAGPLHAATCSAAPLCYNRGMSTISVQDVERDLPAFLRRIQAGESFLVMSGGQPLAEVHPVSPPVTEPRPFGLCAGQFRVPADFDQPLPEDIVKEFEGA